MSTTINESIHPGNTGPGNSGTRATGPRPDSISPFRGMNTVVRILRMAARYRFRLGLGVGSIWLTPRSVRNRNIGGLGLQASES